MRWVPTACDIATVLPPGTDIGRSAAEFAALNAELAGFPVNPNNARTVNAANACGLSRIPVTSARLRPGSGGSANRPAPT